MDRLVKDLHVWQQRQQGRLALQTAAQVFDGLVQFINALLEIRADVVGDLDAGRRDAADLVGQVVLRAVGEYRGGEKQKREEGTHGGLHKDEQLPARPVGSARR